MVSATAMVMKTMAWATVVLTINSLMAIVASVTETVTKMA